MDPRCGSAGVFFLRKTFLCKIFYPLKIRVDFYFFLSRIETEISHVSIIIVCHEQLISKCQDSGSISSMITT